MMNIQYLAVSMILIVLSLVHINASKYQSPRQTNQCPDVNLCNYVQCENGGTCSENKTSVDCYQCQCSAGFTGRSCETSIGTSTGCTPPCLNGGQCQQSGANISLCVCPSDYTGDQCQTSVLATHPCVTTPNLCQNGGTCTMNGADYLCNCPIGWAGMNCETQDTVTTCDPNPCGAHGTCAQIILPNSTLAVFCRCEAQWTGKYCDVNQAATCSIDFCQNTGVCIINGNTPFCVCPSTHTGLQCETLVGSVTTMTATPMTTATPTGIFTTTDTSITGSTGGRCTSNSCLNGGTCYNTGNDFICLCKPQFSGPTCAMQASVTTPNPTTSSTINPCSSNPCQNGGSCYKHSTGFVCVCTAQYTGQICDAVKTTTVPSVTTPNTAITCANQPCQNGATCYNAGSSYFCYCGTGSNYTGKNCDTAIVSSDSNCSLNCSPGYCVPSGSNTNPSVCMCPNGILTPNNC